MRILGFNVRVRPWMGFWEAYLVKEEAIRRLQNEAMWNREMRNVAVPLFFEEPSRETKK